MSQVTDKKPGPSQITDTLCVFDEPWEEPCMNQVKGTFVVQGSLLLYNLLNLILNRFTYPFQHSDQCKDEQSCECAAPGRFATNYTIFVKLNFQPKNGFEQINN